LIYVDFQTLQRYPKASADWISRWISRWSCDAPGAAVGAQLALPLLQERLDGRARAHAAQRAAAAQDAIIRAEARTPGRPCTSSCGARARGALAAAATERDQARRRPALSVRCLSCRQPGVELCFSCTAFNPIQT